MARRINQPTRYQVAVAIPGVQTTVVGYTARRSKLGLYDFFGKIAELVQEAVSRGHVSREQIEQSVTTYDARLGALNIGPVAVYFTGATERHPEVAA